MSDLSKPASVEKHGVQIRLMGEDFEAVKAARKALEELGIVFTGNVVNKRGDAGLRAYGTLTITIVKE